jgi:hypothetical protein
MELEGLAPRCLSGENGSLMLEECMCMGCSGGEQWLWHRHSRATMQDLIGASIVLISLHPLRVNAEPFVGIAKADTWILTPE